MDALQIKCYLLSEPSVNMIGKSSEIRRFAIAQPSSSGFYEQLVEKIQTAFGDLLPEKQHIKTYWLDDENEFVCFSTDSELQYAVDLQAAMRLSQSSKPYENNLFKIYVVKRSGNCRRSKEAKASDDETSPDNTARIHPGVICDGCNGAIFGSRYKCKTCPDFDLCSTCMDKKVHGEHELNKIERPALKFPWASGNHGRHAWRQWRRHCRHHMNQQPQEQQQQQPGQPPRVNPLHETLNNFMPHLANSIPIVSNPEQLKNVGEYLKQFLDPFGIDVSYYVDSLGRNATTQDAGADTKKEAAPEQKTPESKPQEETSSSMETEKPAAAKEDLIDLKASSEPKEAAASSAEAIPSVAGLASQASAPIPPVGSPFEAAASALRSVVSKPTNEQEYNGFNLVDMEKEIKFINCIEQLKGMGYSDDGGWLMRLVIAKDGNINAVLDTLHPSKN